MDELTAIIDVHSHAILPIGRGAPHGTQPDWSPALALEYMERYDIAACVLSVPDAANYCDGPQAREIARRVNEKLAEVVAEHPGRFGALATLPGQDPEGCVAEIEYALDTLGLDGVAASTSIAGRYLGEPEFDPWFAELDRREATLFIHPALTEAAGKLLLGLHPAVLEFMFETTRMLTNMISTGAKRRFSNVRMISTHAGGTVPFLINRVQTLQHTFGVGPGRLELSAKEIRDGAASFYYDLTAATSEAQLDALLKLVSPDQLLMGLDLPFMPRDSFAPALEDLSRHGGLDATAKREVASGNAGRLFPALKKRIGS